MSSNLQNSIWPNTNGNLGNIKVQIPTGTTNDPWPTGDALVGNFVYHKGKLVGFVDTKALIANSSKSTIFPYEYVNISLPSIAEGEMTYNHDQCVYFILNGKVLKGDVSSDEELEIITKKYAGCKTRADIKAVDPNYLTNDIIDGVWKEGLGDLEQGGNFWADGGVFYKCTALTSFISDLSSLTDGRYMFGWCTNLTSFSSDLPSLTSGINMFKSCTNLTSFSSDSSGSPVNLSNLTNGNFMFDGCSNLTSFSSDLSSLTSGKDMFVSCTKLKSFSSDLSSLTDGDWMFCGCSNLTSFSSDSSGSPVNLSNLTNGVRMFSNCTNLTTFTSDLSSLTSGSYMFGGCSNLTSFSSDLSSLTSGTSMFEDCKLDTASVQNIADTINTVTGNPSITIGVENEDDKQIYFEQMRQKGWDVYVDVNVNSGSGNCCASCSSCWNCCASCSSCWATCCASLTTLDETDGEFVAPKPYWAKPVPSDEQHARYIDSEGNFYNILGGDYIYVHDPEEYGMFTSLEDAQAQMRLKKIGEEEIETA